MQKKFLGALGMALVLMTGTMAMPVQVCAKDYQDLLSLGDRLADLAVKLALIARAAEDIAGHALLGCRLNAHRVACQRRRCEGQRGRCHRGRRS